MQIFEEMQARGHEALTLLHHAPSGLKAALAVHSTVLGPAIAGVRLRPMDEQEALKSALTLSESLTLKAALAGLNYGGGACVLLMPDTGVDDPHAREALFRALGRKVRPLQSLVVLTEDIGVTPSDIAFVAQETPATLGVNTDTSSVTGYGVYRGMKAAARSALGSESMRGVRVAILGVGAVGRTLAEHLHREGARLTVADERAERAEALADDLDGVTVVGADDLLDVPCDILAPCGYGHSIHSADVPRLQCRLIAGGEHHPLSRRGEDAVKEAGIMYIPDFAINAAGLIAAATTLTPEQAAERVYGTVSRIVNVADQVGKPPHVVARRMAERRIDLIGSLGRGA
ncbi:Glu/Leu/Phe/Val dehydrogenase [Deinococcus metallilatus]|uniref:Glu/Leu/Phe/Val dehydrogenase n=2 Tax=Deinococcus TaxID=1298 RepID=A0AAJ5JY29_9DEIO|nr:Glu/Leu/Phe/Val dehydrogenase dimerization domain-containing protein [Deinococcus metallilatus]MBB5296352.1 leucine dehydrogenase [Deinococcus metallilatus]QBY09970.1 Glu/Leu/Phe/Val dehydrogenase [Deinococcus metallilatus]RXJ08694.1 Glu/Leu/Phe/Val dehydrogenase [Deinococcus metallilatus]TLK25168.1 Glu/Leu/Phe/Val dehydrogenase [Deinococcus metallilatus]GMA14734.1 branched-chain amino acid dehydrogenase [Deinococcus metallilatus]